jgi:outer membrane autotransporter protein
VVRAGVAAEHDFAGEGGRMGKVFAVANLLHDFSGDRTVTVAGVPLLQNIDATWGEIGAGVSLPTGDAVTLYGHGKYRRSISGEDSSGYNVAGGVRFAW